MAVLLVSRSAVLPARCRLQRSWPGAGRPGQRTNYFPWLRKS
ncbi:hypothetical protein SCATT_57300 [Streptantibioticus cattleyicolor NRRL 8057 = DSM 46488]|uniref:Uncharacterized protein n=1 Tax=Streptantibioticus cattleyicolor (strain ATCC 35852 / DSM 46488 / JCM 4925 / NBRC 14057 / NRRL 8057) TaxID=1003195 RepID=G8WYH1_STREN|nr:hypothetical protein SCATT_57300 [Streptantibioticus cattleyicolor NRRL 8057 = DSM 46488]